MAKKKIPITLLCGYLGAGKTTLLNRVLTNQKGYKVAVIVNDIGEVNVDERLISQEAKITDTSSIVPLTNGCICCTLKSDMVQGIEDLMKTGKFDYILIEASGVCEPMPIAQAIETIKIGKLDNVVGVVDAKDKHNNPIYCKDKDGKLIPITDKDGKPITDIDKNGNIVYIYKTEKCLNTKRICQYNTYANKISTCVKIPHGKEQQGPEK